MADNPISAVAAVAAGAEDPLHDRGRANGADLAARLPGTAHLAVVAGEAFNTPGRVRVCFAVGDHTLSTAFDRLRTALVPAGAAYEADAPMPEETR